MNEISYKPLETEFTYTGFRHRQLKRTGDVALFHKVALKGTLHPKDYDAGFEVVKVTRHNGYDLAGHHFPPAEQYPGSEQWGRNGFTCNTLLEAEIKFDTLLNVDTKSEVVITERVSAPTGKGKRGRVAKVRAEVVYPKTDTWTVRDLLTLNPDYDQPVISLFLKKQVEANKVKTAGLAPKAPNQRGKAANLYSVVI